MHFLITIGVAIFFMLNASAQKRQLVKIIHSATEKKIDVQIGGKPFTSFLYPDSLEKPVLYPVVSANGNTVTRGFPLNSQPGDPTDHPHHIGIWLNFENVNGLDFWNNSYAIPAAKKVKYGWIKTDKIIETTSGNTGVLAYHANWVNINNKTLAQENTRFIFSGTAQQRIIDRITTITADTTLLFTDAKDGLIAIRVAHALQIPTNIDQKFTDDKGNVTIVKGGTDKIPNGNYLSSEGKIGDSVWSTRAGWCKMFGKINNDMVSVVIITIQKIRITPHTGMQGAMGCLQQIRWEKKYSVMGLQQKICNYKKGRV